MSINHICYQTAKWGWFRRNKVFQCKRCQRVGHASINCHFPRRCVKCGEPHGKETCTITANDDKNKLKCVNCSKTGHPASYYGCDYLKFAQSKYNEQRNLNINNFINKVNTQASFARKINPRISFAGITSQQQQQYPYLKGQHNLNAPETANPAYHNQSSKHTGPRQETNNNNNTNEQLQEIMHMMKQQHTTLMTLIAENASRIDYIFNHFEML